MWKASGGFIGENLCQELPTEISSIKAVPANATVRMADTLNAYTGFTSAKPREKYKRLH